MTTRCPDMHAPLPARGPADAAAAPDMAPPDMAALLQRSGVLLGVFDRHDTLQHANPAFLEAYDIRLGHKPTWAELLRHNYVHQRGVIIVTDDFEAWLASARSRRGQQPFRAFETDLWDGRWLWMTETTQPDGGMLCIASDITQLKASEHAMRHARDQAVIASNTDALTGIGNRRYVLGKLDEMLHGLRSPADQLSVVVADLDHFKRINDRLGHAAGDVIIQDFAARSQQLLSASGAVGRVGGEEFMLLLPACRADQAEHIIEQLHAQVRQARPVPARPDCSYTFSAGIAHAQVGDSMETVFRRADLALYEAKLAGRNRSMCAVA
jgi:diguanylate cyclase (GGDEF)-like protein